MIFNDKRGNSPFIQSRLRHDLTAQVLPWTFFLLHPVGSRWRRHSIGPPASGRSWTSVSGRKRSFDACTRVVRHSALHRETTIRTKREGHGDLAGRRIPGKLGS